ncbi:hypothetical protein N7475_007681 [Penicillium sp. IBT 31633x]|nr:hypothetical protein N7475_007681 [Penicillium sp. IBT 31633x]
MSTSTHLFCCPNIQPTQSPIPDHNHPFTEFTKWAITRIGNAAGQTQPSTASHCIQLIRQIPNGPIESTRYFIATKNNFEETPEAAILDANFVKTNDHSDNSSKRSDAKPVPGLRLALSLGTVVCGDLARYMGMALGWDMGLDGGLVWGLGGGRIGGLGGESDIAVEERGVSLMGKGKVGDCDSDKGDEDGDVSSLSSSSSGSGDIDSIADGDINDVEDEAGSSSGSAGDEFEEDDSPEDQEAGSISPPEAQVAFSDSIVDQSFFHVEDYGYYYTGQSSDDYGSYDCGGLDGNCYFE